MSDLQGRIVGSLGCSEGDSVTSGATAVPVGDYKRHLATDEVVLSKPQA